MDKDKLQEILRLHQFWLNNKGGKRADLKGVDLRGIDLEYINLSDADLSYANLRSTNLRGADLSYANLFYANLRDADLEGSNLEGVNLDFSVMPLWCGDLHAHYDDRQIIQQLYHVLSHAQNSKNASNEIKNILLTDNLIELANKFHRVGVDVEKIRRN